MVGKPLNNDDDDEGRDWLHVQSGVTDDDIAMLWDFLRGKPLAASEVRNAIVRILHSQSHDPLGRGACLISMLFDPAQTPKGHERPVWTVDFKRASKGQPNPWRDTRMALAIQACREGGGKSYDEAIAWAVKNFGIGERRAKQIYGRRKDKITKLRTRSVKPDS